MDYASPFCYIDFHKLTEAVKAVGIDQNKLDYNFRTFQIDPTATENPTQTRGEKLNGKKISISWSPQGEHHYDYNVLAIYNHDLTKDGQHKTFLFCWHKQKPIVLVGESGKGNVVNLHVSQDKSLNGSFSNIMYGENI